jgi:outer membrane biosynthesis protein TonB
MRRDARFWRNVVLITVVHVAALIALLRWAGASKIESAQQITWLNTADNDTSATVDSSTPEQNSKPEETPTPETTSPPEQGQPVPVFAKSEIELPTDTPHPTPTASATPKPSPIASPKPSPKKKTSPKPTATPEKKKSKPQATPAKKKENTKKSAAKTGDAKKSEKKASGETTAKNRGATGGREQTSGTSTSANGGWYGDMLHDRFYREWAQPTTVVASGAKLSALAKIRIEKDGRISDFKIVRPSGNVLVDESVAAVGKKVTRVDGLPTGIGNGGHYDVNINFALNSK